MANNFDRMMQLVTEFFDAKHDPEQISVNEEEREKLLALHTTTLSELANEDGSSDSPVLKTCCTSCCRFSLSSGWIWERYVSNVTFSDCGSIPYMRYISSDQLTLFSGMSHVQLPI